MARKAEPKAGPTAAVGYLRVSTDKQDLRNQRGAINAAAAAEGYRVRFVEETVSSRKDERQVQAVVEALEPGQVLMVVELSRLARSIGEVFELVQALKRKGAFLWILSPEVRTDKGNALQVDMLLFALSAAAGIERDLISERTKKALQARKDRGMKLGRPEGSKLDERTDEISRYEKLGINKAATAKLLGVSRSTLYAYLRRKERGNGKGRTKTGS